MRLNFEEQRTIRHFYIKVIALKLKLTRNPKKNEER